MATLDQNPLIFTVADVGATVHTTPLFPSGRIRVAGIRWDDPSTAAHRAVLNDGDGNVIWAGTCQADNASQESLVPFWFTNGIVVNACQSGTLYVYLMT
jgi:hypothetical protein